MDSQYQAGRSYAAGSQYSIGVVVLRTRDVAVQKVSIGFFHHDITRVESYMLQRTAEITRVRGLPYEASFRDTRLDEGRGVLYLPSYHASCNDKRSFKYDRVLFPFLEMLVGEKGMFSPWL